MFRIQKIEKEREGEKINKYIERCKERRAIAAAHIYIRISGRQRVKTGVREINIIIRPSKGDVFFKVQLLLVPYIRIEITFMFLFRSLRRGAN